jgi:hypothetical protein
LVWIAFRNFCSAAQCGGFSPIASRMVWNGLYCPRLTADPFRTGSGVCELTRTL